SAIRSELENMTPDLAGNIVDNGIILTVCGALIRGIDTYLAEIVKNPVKNADVPLLTGAYGPRQGLDEPEKIKEINDTNYSQ
ncbi:rod shape-determining protein, partial [Aliarcobacter butzleri]